MLLQGSFLDPLLCNFVETPTPSNAWEFAREFNQFRDTYGIVRNEKVGRALVQSNLDDSVRLLTIAEQYKPSGFTFAIFTRDSFKGHESVYDIENFLSFLSNLGFSVLPCDEISDIEIPKQKAW